METQTESLIEKIKGLPPDKISEVEDFVDFLSQRTLQQARRVRHEAIAVYAAQFASIETDMDEDWRMPQWNICSTQRANNNEARRCVLG